MSDLRTLTPREAVEILDSMDRVVITCHVRPDGDTLGTAKALAVMLRMLGKEARITCADPVPERLSFIMEEGDFADPEELAPLCREGGWRTVAVDVASPSQWGRLGELLPTPELVIDHHAMNIPFAPHFTVAEASSASEALWQVAREYIADGRLTLTAELALPMYTAISSDTGCFRFSNVTPDTLRIAAELMEAGIDGAKVNRLLFDAKPIEQLRAEAFIGSSLQRILGGAVAYAVITLRDTEELGFGYEHFETAIDVVRSLRGVEIAFVLKEVAPGEYKASLRSTDRDVAAVAAVFGGGGHLRAAGCTVRAESKELAAEAVISALDRATRLQ